MTNIFAFQVLGTAFAKPVMLAGLVVFWVGTLGICFQMEVEAEAGEKYDARARWVCLQKASRINKGGGDQLRLGWRGACGSCF